MCQHWLNRLLIVGGAAVVLATATADLPAAITVVPDPEGGMRPDQAAVFTVDPWALVDPGVRPANRGLAADRQLRQSFQNPLTLDVGEIVLSYDVTNAGVAAAVGMALRFYEVDDVNGSWVPGDLVRELVIPDGIPPNDQYMSFVLTGDDVFTLPARGTPSNTLGYAIEISTAQADPTDGNPGVFFWEINTNPYPDGRAYREGVNPTAGDANSDFGLALFGTVEEPCDPGDVNCDGFVTTADLEIIAAHFRQQGGRDEGDLTGNGFIDFDDFRNWKNNYPGAFPGSGTSFSEAVPEPMGALMLLVGAGLVAARGRRRRWSR